MSNRPIPDPVEATFRDLRGAVYAGDGRAAMAAIERSPDRDTLQYAGDGLRLALARGVTGAAPRAGEHIALLRNRDLDGDEDLAIELGVGDPAHGVAALAGQVQAERVLDDLPKG